MRSNAPSMIKHCSGENAVTPMETLLHRGLRASPSNLQKIHVSRQLQPAARYVANVDEGTVHLHICSSIATEFETSLHPIDLGLAPSNPLSKFQLRLTNGVSASIRSVTGTYLY
ncbi:hypothetical protein V6N11_023998 [Hibiscus sabdariffa]|uniref:Uncharacterized protein n=1 Tax=Hibiscus sabdariffa TaxID=183260 RepID=A0ABR2TNU9_9ROSI